MRLLGNVLGTFSASNDSQNSMPRPKVDSLVLIEGYGIQNDKFAQKDLDKTVMILGINSYLKAKENDISLAFGSLGENIIFDFEPHSLEVGTILHIGTCEIEITEKCTICNHLTIFDKKLPKIVKDCRGLYCKILKDGTIKRDLEVYTKE
jgi:MOSC domain-containing protein YiiM